MLSAPELRAKAREALQNKWKLAVGTGFIAFLLGGSDSGNVGITIQRQVEDINQLLAGNGYHYESMLPFVTQTFTPVMGILLLWTLILLIIGGATTIGYARFNLSLVDRREASFHQLFSEYDRLPRSIAMYILRALYIFLWGLLLVIPGIIASYRYAMTPFIMAEDRDIDANAAITLSKEMMKGFKGELFYLHLTFLGWALLSAFTLGIGYLWVGPYIKAAESVFYREVSRSYWERNPQNYRPSGDGFYPGSSHNQNRDTDPFANW